MNTIAIEPADITLKYNRGEITNEWLAFTPTGDDIGEFADNRDGAIELLDIDLDSCELID
jgi:hypothetical protein